MEYSVLKGFLVFWLTQHCTSEGPSTFFRPTTAVILQDGPTSPHEPELPSAEVVPVPPSLREVQQVVQEASEQVDGREAEEMLKELLERVVEAALGYVEGGGEARSDETAEQETVEVDAEGNEKGVTGAEAKVQEQAAEEKESRVEDMGIREGDTGGEEEQEVAEVNTLEDVAEEEKGADGAVEIAAGSVEESTAGVNTGAREAEEAELINDTELRFEVEDILKENGGYIAEEEQVELSDEVEAAVLEIQEVKETPPGIGLAGGSDSEQEEVAESDPSLIGADVVQKENVQEWEESLVEETQAVGKEEEVVPSENSEMDIMQTMIEEPAEWEEEILVKDTEGPDVEDEQGGIVLEGGAAEEAGAGDRVEGAERHGESVTEDDTVASVNEGLGDHQIGEDEQFDLDTSHSSEKQDQEVPVISAPEPGDSADASKEKSAGDQAHTTSPSLVGVEAKENTLGNEIISPTDDILQHDLVLAQPTLDNSVKDVLTKSTQAEGEEPGEASELVEDTHGSKDTGELDLEAWKIGAISATVLLVLETIVILIYLFKCHNKNSSQSLQRECEEGCVEPEAATGGDCSDDTLPAVDGDHQQIVALDPSDLVSTLVQNKERHEEECVIAMSDIPPSSTEQLDNAGPGPDSSQDLRTSTL